MTKLILLYLFIVLSIFKVASQNLINSLRQKTVCLGMVDSFKDQHKTQTYFSPVGTGILMSIKTKSGDRYACIITAKHVVESKSLNWFPQTMQVRFSEDEISPFNKNLGMKIDLVKNNKLLWFSHPDSTVDLACIPLLDFYTLNNMDTGHIFHILNDNDVGINSDIYDGAEIFVLGYPGFAGFDILVKSILRQGIISWTNPIKPEENTFLIDCNIYPGNSGGPVFTVPFGIGKSPLGPGKTTFAGIVTKIYYETQNATDSVRNKVFDKKDRQIFYSQKAALAIVEPSTRVIELLKYVEGFYLFEQILKRLP
jgi:hypothetical protein